MPVPAGTLLGPYEVVSAIGAGGMGEVYRARDTRLDRTVAIKILPPAFSSDPERLARFEREAKTLAALNHPNIAQVYGLESFEGGRALVMEFVEGDDLAERIARGPMPLDEALPIARQIADALAAAHERGIIHRDLKPANIRIRADGAVKVLDFGLSKALDGSAASGDPMNSPTITSPATQLGMILGTAAYMSPEQARGRPADRRADVWAFGIVLFEMLTGERPFKGAEITDVLASILKDSPAMESVPSSTPPAVRRVLRRSLEKDRSKRLDSMTAVRLDLDDALEHDGDGAAGNGERRWRRIAVSGITAALVFAVAAVTYTRRPAARPPGLAFTIELPQSVEAAAAMPALSPDGSRIVFVASDRQSRAAQLYVRRLDHPVASPIAGTGNASAPFFSADGKWLAFFNERYLRIVPADGGAPQDIVEVRDARGGSFTADGRIVYAPAAYGPLHAARTDGGDAAPFTALDTARNELSHRYPRLLADGSVLFVILTDDPDRPVLGIVPPAGGAHRVLLERAMHPVVLPGDYVLYAKAGRRSHPTEVGGAVDIVATRYRNGALEPSTTPVFSRALGVQGWGFAAYTATPDLLVTMTHRDPPAVSLAWVGRDGVESPLPVPELPYSRPRLSPDGKLIVASVSEGGHKLRMIDVSRGIVEPFAPALSDATGAVWSPDGTEVAVAAIVDAQPRLLRVPLTNPSAVRVVGAPPNALPTSWSRTGTLAVAALTMRGRTDLHLIDRTEAARVLLATPATEHEARFSPDGQWLAFTVDGVPYVQAASGGGRMTRLSQADSAVVVWSRDGRELFLQQGLDVFAVAVAPGGELSQPRRLFEYPGTLEDVAADGRLLFTRASARRAEPLRFTVTTGRIRDVIPGLRER